MLTTGSKINILDKKYCISVAIDSGIALVITAYVDDAIKHAADKRQALLIKIDMPGGLIGATRKIVQAMQASPPVYVIPNRARATSAGFLSLWRQIYNNNGQWPLLVTLEWPTWCRLLAMT